MPEGHYSSVVVLCEDRAQYRFIAAWITAYCKVNPRCIRERLPLAGRGSGEQFVREQFGLEVRAHRQKVPKLKSIMLITVVDADVIETQQRRRQLDCDPPLGGDDRIYIFIPKRNIETWIRELNYAGANETDDFRKRRDNGEINDAAREFLNLVRSSVEPSLPSLGEGVREARRVSRAPG